MKTQRTGCYDIVSRGIFASVTVLILSLQSACVESEMKLVPGLQTSQNDSEARGLMQELAVSISAIEDAGISEDLENDKRDTVISELDRISGLITQLERDDVQKNTAQFDQSHEFVMKYLNTLASEVELAKAQAGDKNADLFIAGQLSGACRGCHDKLWPES